MSTSSTPARSSPASGSGSASKTRTNHLLSGSKSSDEPFTPEMQDAQARDKDPSRLSPDDSDENSYLYGVYDQTEPYASRQLRTLAAQILSSPELLMMAATSRCDSVPGTRSFYTKILCGYADSEDETVKSYTDRIKEVKESPSSRRKSQGKNKNIPNN